MNVTMLAALGAKRIRLAAICAIGAVFVACSLLAFRDPGLYMDAVNPDYDVVGLLNSNASVAEWVLPGNLLFGKFLVLGGLYSGSYALYWALPFYLVFGGSVLSVRLAHLCVGLVILAFAGMLCRSLTKSNRIALIAMLVLAVDPAFVYLFRTQAYVIAFPLVFFLPALYVMNERPTVRGYSIAGILIGLSGFGYFVYLFTLPGLVLFALRDARIVDRRRTIGVFFGGFVIGMLPYALGYGLMISVLGFSGLIELLQSSLNTLHVASGQGSYVSQVAAVVAQLWSVATSEWTWRTFWQTSHFDIGQTLKTVAVIALPIAGVYCYRTIRGSGTPLALVGFPLVSFILVATFFGARLGGHEYGLLLPLAYVLAATGAGMVLSRYVRAATAIACGAAVLVIFNLFTTGAFAARLSSAGASGFYSSIVSSYPEQVVASGDKTPYVFWTWGGMMAFEYETGGSVPVFDSSGIQGAACRYGHANIVLLGADADKYGLGPTFPMTGLKVTGSKSLHDQRSGFGYEVVSVKPSNDVAASCANANAGAAVAGGAAAPAQPDLRVDGKTYEKGAVFFADPNPIPPTTTGELPAITVKWSDPKVQKVEIHMNASDGVLFTAGGNLGAATTGPWVRDGAKFYLQDVDRGSPGRTISVLTVSACKNCSAK